MRAWFAQTSASDWESFNDLRNTFPAADLVGNCTVFNIAGNNYRLIARVFYGSHKVYVLKVMTHVEYDRQDWPTQCGCFQPPPARSRQARDKMRRTAKRRKS